MRATRPLARLLVLALAAAIAACAGHSPRPSPAGPPVNRCGDEPAFAAGSLRATLWMRTSVEYRAASEALYRSAVASLARGLADPAWTAEPRQTAGFGALPPAIVMDIDETVLDNSEPQARMLREGTCLGEFPALWDAWIAERSATAVPGVLDFIRAARELTDTQGRAARVFFITNRECRPRPGDRAPCPQEDDTLANLRALGIDSPTLADDLQLKRERPEWGSEKLSRRLEVAKSHRIVLNVGDDFGDFLEDVRRESPAARERARCAHHDRWGRDWFLIPNPVYGSWLVALGRNPEAALASDWPTGDCDG